MSSRFKGMAGHITSMAPASDAQLEPIGVIRSDLRRLEDAPRQGTEGAPDAWIDVEPWAADALGPIEAIDGTPVVDIKPVL